ncbi:ATP-binding domain-containing protein [Cardiosporidium cionae]|uniref:Diphthine--ammonia ligase n=1 Tax=Cardiosporidium cionae TaxID=476202 RepID=A0ABQ7J6W9_9APIC|nr:ATP-binding domain-containing protein [Cardiosporidium cionae]|eukprot:KAF8819727.1 ATP-binding domain-containing protein [Cardiosporidium cionae]
MKVIGLISGGKDSICNLCYCKAFGHDILALAHLQPKNAQLEADSFMYQSVGSPLVESIAECMDLPLLTREITGDAIVSKNLSYQATKGDEVEDLYELLLIAKKHFPLLEAISCGAILSDYQRLRVENVCDSLLQQMISMPLSAILIKTASMGLYAKHVGQSIEALQSYFVSLNEKFGFHICGEGGEYETFTLDAPLFSKKLVM